MFLKLLLMNNFFLEYKFRVCWLDGFEKRFMLTSVYMDAQPTIFHKTFITGLLQVVHGSDKYKGIMAQTQPWST